MQTWTHVSHWRTSRRLKYNEKVFSFFKTSGPTTTTIGREILLYVSYCKIRSRYISQGVQVDHEWSQFKFLACMSGLRNVILKSKSLLTLSRWCPLSYRNQSIELLCKLMDWFLYDNSLRHERVNCQNVL